MERPLEKIVDENGVKIREVTYSKIDKVLWNELDVLRTDKKIREDLDMPLRIFVGTSLIFDSVG